jgi:hypothetical protein
LKKKGVKLGSPQNLTSAAREKGVKTIVRKRIENDNWKTARMFIEHFQMKNGYLNYSEISRQLNEKGYKTRRGFDYSPSIVRRLFILA